MANPSTPSNQPKSSIPTLFTKEIQDLYLRQNFQRLTDYFSNQNQLVTFNFFELNITAALTSAKKLNHNLNYIPKDIVITQITGLGTIQFLYGSFDTTSISYLATGPCRVRFYVGTYFGDQSQVSAQKSDIQTITSSPESLATENSIINVTGSYTVLGTEELVLIATSSGSSGSVQLPNAQNSKGFSFWVEKTDLNFNPIVINTLASDKSIIYPDGALNTSINIQYERVHLFCDGVNWYILTRDYPRGWNSSNPNITGSITNPVQGITQSTNVLYWRKSGDSMELRLEYAQSTAGTVGNGSYQFQLPVLSSQGNQLTLDHLKLSNAGTLGAQALGSGYGYDGSTEYPLIPCYGTSTSLELQQSNGAARVGSSLIALSGVIAAFSFQAIVPITGWKG